MTHKMQLLRYGYRQTHDWTCGPAVARLLLCSFQIEMGIDEIKRALKTTRGGTTNGNLLQLLRKKGLSFKVKKSASLKDLVKYLKNHWVVVAYHIPERAGRKEELHYSIVTCVTKTRAYFHDTWYGANHSYSLPYFLKNWQHKDAEGWLLAVKK